MSTKKGVIKSIVETNGKKDNHGNIRFKYILEDGFTATKAHKTGPRKKAGDEIELEYETMTGEYGDFNVIKSIVGEEFQQRSAGADKPAQQRVWLPDITTTALNINKTALECAVNLGRGVDKNQSESWVLEAYEKFRNILLANVKIDKNKLDE